MMTIVMLQLQHKMKEKNKVFELNQMNQLDLNVRAE